MPGINIFYSLYVLGGSYEQRRARVQTVRHPFKDASPAVTGLAPGLFRKKSQRGGFAHKAQLAVGLRDVWRIHVNAAIDEGSMKISDKRAHITG